MRATDPHQFPGTDDPRRAFVCLDLDEDGAHVGDYADVATRANLVPYLEIHFRR